MCNFTFHFISISLFIIIIKLDFNNKTKSTSISSNFISEFFSLYIYQSWANLHTCLIGVESRSDWQQMGQISVHFGSPPNGFVPFGANLTHSDPNLTALQQIRLDISAKGVTSNFSLRSGQSDHWMICALNNLINVLSGWLARIFCLKLQINASLILMLSIIHAVLTCWFVVCQFYVFALWAWGQVSEQINVGLIWTKSWNKFCVWHTSKKPLSAEWMSDLNLNWVRLPPNGTNLRLFNIRLASHNVPHWNLFLKKSQIFFQIRSDPLLAQIVHPCINAQNGEKLQDKLICGQREVTAVNSGSQIRSRSGEPYSFIYI